LHGHWLRSCAFLAAFVLCAGLARAGVERSALFRSSEARPGTWSAIVVDPNVLPHIADFARHSGIGELGCAHFDGLRDDLDRTNDAIAGALAGP
jgi:hypothetical protein